MAKGDSQEKLAGLAGKAAYASFRIFGVMPLRPGDDWYGLKSLKSSAGQLDLVFDFGGDDLPVTVYQPSGIEVGAKTLTVKQADRVTFGGRLDVKRAGKILAVVLDGDKQERPFADEPAFEAY